MVISNIYIPHLVQLLLCNAMKDIQLLEISHTLVDLMVLGWVLVMEDAVSLRYTIHTLLMV